MIEEAGQWLTLWVLVLFCVAMFAGAVKDSVAGNDGSFAFACAMCATLICVIAFGFKVVLS
jgi:hypothetical protein